MWLNPMSFSEKLRAGADAGGQTAGMGSSADSAGAASDQQGASGRAQAPELAGSVPAAHSVQQRLSGGLASTAPGEGPMAEPLHSRQEVRPF